MSRAAFLTDLSEIRVDDDSECQPLEYGLKLKIDACAICGSDLRIYQKGNNRVSYPAIIGHEVCGTVVDSRMPNYRSGDKVSLGADIPCGQCDHCRRKRPNLCKNNLAIGYQLKGGFCEYMYIDSSLVDSGPIVKVDVKQDYPYVSCLAEPLACALNGIDKIRMSEFSKTLIYGGGPIGIMIAEVIQRLYSPTELVIIEPSAFRRDFIRNLVPDLIVLSSDNELATSSEYDFIFTCCSSFQTHMNAMKLIGNGGSINFFGGLPYPAPNLDVCTNDLHYKEITLTGSHGSTPQQHKIAAQMIDDSPLFYHSLITHVFSLTDITEAFKLGLSGQAMKIVVTP